MEWFDLALTGQPECLLHAQDVGSFEGRIRVGKVHPRPAVIDRVDRPSQRLELVLCQSPERLSKIPQDWRDTLGIAIVPEPICFKVASDALRSLRGGRRAYHTVDLRPSLLQKLVEQKRSKEAGRASQADRCQIGHDLDCECSRGSDRGI